MAAGITAPTLSSEAIGNIAGVFVVRNTMLMAWLAMAILIIVAFAARSTGYKLIPKRFQALMESIVEGLHELFLGVLGDEALTRKAFPLVATIFLFIVTANWMGILPGVGTIKVPLYHAAETVTTHTGVSAEPVEEHASSAPAATEEHIEMVPLFRSMNADVNMTLAFAVIAIIAVQVFGISALGARHYTGKFFIAPWRDPIGSLVGLLEIIGEFSRMVSFTFRLFGNIFAGEVLLVVIAYLLPYAGPIPFMGLELFVGLIQALVFAMLTLVFIKMASTPHGDHDDDHGLSKKELSQRVLSAA